jgi:hypothetical protein
MGDWNVDPEYDGPVYHVITCKSGWLTCHGWHEKVAQVSDCYRKTRVMATDIDRYFPCNWLIEQATEDGTIAVECGALARVTDRGFDCEAGHEHVIQEARIAEGWEYAEDEGEAMQLARAGVEPRTFATGQVWPR